METGFSLWREADQSQEHQSMANSHLVVTAESPKADWAARFTGRLFAVGILFVPLLAHLAILPDPFPPIYVLDVLECVLLGCVLHISYHSNYFSGWRSGYGQCLAMFAICFVVSTTLSLLSGNPPMEVLYLALRHGLAISMFVAAYVLVQVDPRFAGRLAHAYVYSTAIMVILAVGLQRGWSFPQLIATYLSPHYNALAKSLNDASYGDIRLNWGIGSATAMGGLLSIGTLVSACLLFSNARRKSGARTVLCLAVLLINCFGLMHTYTRHAWIATAIVLLGALVRNAAIALRFRLVLFVTAICTIVVLAMVVRITLEGIDKGTDAQAASITERLAFRELSIESRYGRIPEVFRAAESEPLSFILGAGPGASALAERHSTRGEKKVQGEELFAHNFVFAAIQSWGVIGALAFGLLYLGVLIGLLRVQRLRGGAKGVAECLLMIMAAIAFMMAADHYFVSLPAMELLLWTVLGCGAGRVCLNRGMLPGGGVVARDLSA